MYMDVSARSGFDETHDQFRSTVRRFFDQELAPHMQRFETQGMVDREFWKKAGSAGLLCPTVPEAYGGPGLDFAYNTIVTEELCYMGSSASLPLQSDIIADYFVHLGTEEQRRRYLPGLVSGDIIASIAMTEPGAGSDLQGIATTARKDGDRYVVNGSKTYISSGQHSDVVIVVAKTDPVARGRGISLILVDTDTPGFARGRNLDKIGQHSADTSELFFNDVEVPVSNCLGPEGGGFTALMTMLPQERLCLAIGAHAGAQRAFDEAVAFTKSRSAFGQRVFDFQNSRFTLADMAARLQAGWAHLDWAIHRHVAGKLTTAEASAAKLWHSETQWLITDAALQLHGGAGYMNEYLIARLWRDARVQRIHGGTSEIMKEIIGRSL